MLYLATGVQGKPDRRVPALHSQITYLPMGQHKVMSAIWLRVWYAMSSTGLAHSASRCAMPILIYRTAHQVMAIACGWQHSLAVSHVASPPIFL